MLTINNLKTGTIFIYQGNPFEVLEVKHLHLARGGAVLQAKIKNLITGNILSKTFKPADNFEEAEILKKKVKYLYSHRGEYWFSEENNPSQRFNLKGEQIGESKNFLKPGMILEILLFKEKPIDIFLPIKVDLKVIEAPPGVKGDTVQGGTKTVILETGIKVQTPLFIKEGDIIRINTEKGEYVERVKMGP